MGIFDAIRNDLRHRLNATVEGVEQRNVAAVYETAIEQAIARVGEHQERVAGLVVLRDREASKRDALAQELQQVVTAIQAAVSEDDDDTAVVLIARKDQLATELEDKTRLVDEVTGQVEATKQGLKELRSGVEELRRERERSLANQAVAEAAIEIDETISGLSDKAHIRSLDSVRESIGVLERRANPGYIDADGNSVRGRAEAMGRKAKEQAARDQLEALKRAHFGPTSVPLAASDPAPEEGDEEEETGG